MSTIEPLKCRSLVVKVASRCNLNCTYCYMFNMGDRTYKNQPKTMPDEVVDALVNRTLSHCREHNLKEFLFGFHGGEPLLAGPDFFKKFIFKARNVLLPEVVPYFSLQTNATLLTDEWCELLGKLHIQIGISLDGIQSENDRFRIDHAGKGTYPNIIRGLKKAQASTHLQAPPAVLSVLNINADPVETYEHLKSLQVKSVDFLLPDSTYDQPPPLPFHNKENAYADWLIKIFDRWIDEPSDEKIHISIFERIITSILGSDTGSELMGAGNNELLVIETDGSIEALDVLKICGNGFTKQQMNVLTHDFDEALQNELASLYNTSHQKLCKQCLACPVNELCGGGYLPHRYSHKNGFNNPSVYCGDLLKLITHIQNKVLSEMPLEVLDECGVSLLDYDQAKEMIRSSTGDMEPSYISELEKF